MLATAISAVFAAWWMEPVGQLLIQHAGDGLSLAAFLGSRTLISYICQAMHRARTRAVDAETQARLAEQRERVEEERRKTKEFSRRIVESSSDCIRVLDLDGRLLSKERPRGVAAAGASCGRKGTILATTVSFVNPPATRGGENLGVTRTVTV